MAWSLPRLWLPIPHDVAPLRRENPEAAEGWHQAVRESFQAAFAAGFLRDLVPRCGYILQRRLTG